MGFDRDRRSFTALILTTACLAACDSGSAPPPEKQPEPPTAAPAEPAPAPSPGREQPPAPVPDTTQPRPSAGTAKQPPRGTAPATPQSRGGRGEGAGQSFSVYALSRGSGVPPAAREAQQKVQELVESDRSRGVDVNVRATRIGLEGERKLCVTYADTQEAARALASVRAMVQGVDLVNVVVEPCEPPPPASPTKEKP